MLTMEKLAEKYINDHNKPLVKLELIGTKLFLPLKIHEECNLVEKNLEIQENALKYERVDRRCARIKAIWLITENLAKIIKFSGSYLTHFGFQNKTGKFLFPEEALFLLETNKLELFLNDIPLSIQEAYMKCLQTTSLNRYQIYKKLALQGYKITKSKSEDEEEDSEGESSKKVRKLEKNCNLIDDILKKLREKGPKPSEFISSNTQPDYFIYLPTNSIKNKPDYNLFVEQNDLNDLSGNENDIYAVCTNGNLAFYKFCNTKLPVLPAIVS